MGEESVSVDFDRAAEFYDETRDVGEQVTAKMIDVLADELQGRGRVLEIGVGTGIVAKPLADRGFDVTGVDLSAAMLAKMVDKAGGRPPMPLLRADATRLPFRDGAFGAAYGRHVLHLITSWRTAVAELCRVVGHGVVLIEAGSAATGWLELWNAMRTVLGPEADHVGLDLAHDGLKVLDDAFEAAGAVPRRIEEITYPDEDTVAGLLEEVARRSPSWTWRVPDEHLHRAIEIAQRWTLDRYGSLEVRLEETATVRWRAYDVGI